MMRKLARLISLAFTLAACGGGDPDAASAQHSRASPTGAAAGAVAAVCDVVEPPRPLPSEVRESSGLARSARDPRLFWTHNDAGNEPYLFAVDEEGRLVRRVRVTGASLVDWEDIEAAPCDGGTCLYVGDIGDNDARRARVTIYRLREPPELASESGPVEALHARFPDGPRDAEGLFADRAGNLFVVTKGRGAEVALYRYGAPQRPGAEVVLERVRTLFPQPEDDRDRVTAATASPDGSWVGIRTYRQVYLYRMRELVGGEAVEPIVADLSRIGEVQGEGLVLADDGSMWVSTEAQHRGDQPRWAQLKCSLPE